MKRILSLILLVPAAAVAVVLSVANRQAVTFRLDPFAAENPALAVTLPFFVFLFASLITGLLLGGVVVWWRQGRHRREARRRRAEAIRWREEADDLRRRVAALPPPADDRAA